MEQDYDLFKNDGQHLWMRVDGTYYKRTIGTGWAMITPGQVADVINWDRLADNQRDVFMKAYEDHQAEKK